MSTVPETVQSRLAIGFRLDSLWAETIGIDPRGIADAVSRAELTDLADGLRMRVAIPADLIVLKLAAAAEPRRRPSKRQHDLADVVALMEEYPELRTPETLARLRDVRLSLQALDDG